MKRYNSFIFKFFDSCIVASAALLTLSGCIEEYEADIPADDSNLLVVEGTIRSGRSTFALSRTQPLRGGLTSYDNASYAPSGIVTATVSVRGSDGSEYRAQVDDAGFTCWIDALSPDVEYYLHIETGGEVYESEPQKPLPTEEIANVSGVQNTPESNIDVLVTPDAPFDPDKVNYYSWTYDETWVVYPDYTTVVFFDKQAMKPVIKRDQFPGRGWKDATGSTIMVGASTNYDGQHIRRLKLYDIDRGHERIRHRYSGLVRQRAISKAEYEYELARRQAGSEMGGLFTPQPSALPTNIHCLTSSKRVIGFVGCSQNTSEYRFFLDSSDFSVDYPVGDSRRWLNDCTEEDCCRMVDMGMFLCVWDDTRMMPNGKLRTAWAYRFQLDVRYGGAYLEKPVFWKD